MPPPQHLQIINPAILRANDDSCFGLFPKLSAELRLHIWRYSLIEKQRLLQIQVAHPIPDDDLVSEPAQDVAPYSIKNALNKLISNKNYNATVEGHHLFSKLLRVNREARQAALEFYRVHIPCNIRSTNMYLKPTPSILYINPEHDFIHLTGDSGGSGDTKSFVDFIHDLKAYDPKNTGLLNLALEANEVTTLYHQLPTIPEPPAKAAFVDCLSHLREIIWVAHSRAGRAILGAVDGFPARVGARFNHSMPIIPASPSFRLLARDPRPVGPELRYVLTGCSDPRRMRRTWRALLARWEIEYDGTTTTTTRTTPPRERVLFAYDPPTHERVICDRVSAEMFLRDEEESWLRLQAGHYRRAVLKCAGKVPVESPEELEKAVRPAIGFWLFPVEALGPLDDDDLGGMKLAFDMADFWPELALAYM